MSTPPPLNLRPRPAPPLAPPSPWVHLKYYIEKFPLVVWKRLLGSKLPRALVLHSLLHTYVFQNVLNKDRQVRKRSVPELRTEPKKVALLSEICDQVCRDKRGGCPEVKIDPFQDLQVTWARVKVAGLGGGDHPRSPHPLTSQRVMNMSIFLSSCSHLLTS